MECETCSIKLHAEIRTTDLRINNKCQKALTKRIPDSFSFDTILNLHFSEKYFKYFFFQYFQYLKNVEKFSEIATL